MQPKKHYFAHIPTIAIFIVFAMSAPLGVLLFILKSIDKNAEKEETAAAQAQADYRSDLGPAPAQTAPRQENEPTYGHDVPTKEQKDAKERHKLLTTLCTIGGAVFLFAGFSTLFMDGADSMMEAFTAIAQMLGGGAALLTGLRMDRTRKLERLLDKIAGDRDNIPLDELFAAAGIDAAKGRTVVESAISHGYFGADAYIDNRTNTLVVRGAAPQPPRKPKPAPAPEPAPADQYTAILQQLRQVNDAIPDPVMTIKISRLEAVSARIFELAKQDPGKKAQLQKFMDYYLPTALKLLNTYASLPAQDVQGENIADAKKNIERSMDLLVTAFENQLDKLFQSDALDVTTDIAALEGMLNMDGLTDSAFGRPRPSHAKPWICRHFCQWFFRFISNFISTVKFHSVRQFQSFCNFSSRCNNNTWFFLSGFYMIRTEVCRASCMRPCTAVPTRSKGGLSYDEICFRMEAGAFQRRSRCPAGSTLLLCARRNSCTLRSCSEWSGCHLWPPC